MNRFAFPAKVTLDRDDGGYVVTFRDIPEAITQGDSIPAALTEAADCLEEAIAAYIDDKLDIPEPSTIQQEEYLVFIPIQTALKASVYLTMRDVGMTKVELASILNVDEKEVRRILDPRHGTKLSTMEKALGVLGKRIELRLVS
jgi:antitoxin HicB